MRITPELRTKITEHFYYCRDDTQNGSRAKASFYGRMIISMILIISIFQSLAASTRTAWAQKVRTVGVHANCVLPYTHL